MSHVALVDLERSASALVPVCAEMPEFPGYRTNTLIGEGGLGVVYSATCLKTREQVAIKVSKPGVVGAAYSLVSESEFLEQFMGVSGFPQLVEPAQEVEGKSQWYFVMKLISGQSLLKTFLKMPMTNLLNVLCQVASALAETHDRGIIHGDVKIENVILSDGAIATLIDFGLSRWEDPQQVSLKYPFGTYAFLAPEMWIPGNLVSPAIDVYAFGMMVHEGISGIPPFLGIRSLREYREFHLNRTLSKLSSDSPINPNLVQAMLHKYPQYRPKMDEVRAELLRACKRGGEPYKTVWTRIEQFFRFDFDRSLRRLLD